MSYQICIFNQINTVFHATHIHPIHKYFPLWKNLVDEKQSKDGLYKTISWNRLFIFLSYQFVILVRNGTLNEDIFLLAFLVKYSILINFCIEGSFTSSNAVLKILNFIKMSSGYVGLAMSCIFFFFTFFGSTRSFSSVSEELQFLKISLES